MARKSTKGVGSKGTKAAKLSEVEQLKARLAELEGEQADKPKAGKRGRRSTNPTARFAVGVCFDYHNKQGGTSSHEIVGIEGNYVVTDAGNRFKVASLPKLEKLGIVELS